MTLRPRAPLARADVPADFAASIPAGVPANVPANVPADVPATASPNGPTGRIDLPGPATNRPYMTALLVAALLIGAGALVGIMLLHRDIPIHARSAPLFARWGPTVSATSILAPATAITIGWAYLRVQLSWRATLVAAWLASIAWTLSLAMIRGWQIGVVDPLTEPSEYLVEVARVSSVAQLLSDFTERIVRTGPESLVTHASGHPPGALLVFVGLDRIGLGGGAWAGALCIVVGASSVVALAITVKALAVSDLPANSVHAAPGRGEELARRVIPFAVLTPAAIWVGVSADALFLGLSAWAIAGFAVALTSKAAMPNRLALALLAGLGFGVSLYLSYGLILIGTVPLAALWLVSRRSASVPRDTLVLVGATVLGLVIVAIAFAAVGFIWWDGLAQVRIRYFQGYGGTRPYPYWVWANFAAFAIALGPAVIAGLGGLVAVNQRSRAGTQTTADQTPPSAVSCTVNSQPVTALVTAALISVMVATLSGMSKAEVERIWLPFGIWVGLAVVALPRSQRATLGWLAAQALTAVAISHIWLTPW